MAKPSTVSIHLVTWNSQTHVAACLSALTAQTYVPTTVMIVDNGSVDGTVRWLEEHYPQLHLLRNTRNLGFCRAHNQAFRLSEADYNLVINPDVVLAPDWVSRGVAWLDAHPGYGSYGGKLRRFSYSPDEIKEVVTSTTIDSTGLVVHRSRHAIDRGSGQTDTGQYDRPADVFGHSGASVLYRRAALESIRFHDEFFDQDFFAYKDDLDVAWRLQRMGWASRYDPQAIGYHHRHLQGQSQTNDLVIAKHHGTHDRFRGYYSYRNHWLLLEKNERWSTFWRDAPWIIWYEWKKFIFLLSTHPSSLRGAGQAWRLHRRMLQKARLLDKQARRSALDVRRQFFLSP